MTDVVETPEELFEIDTIIGELLREDSDGFQFCATLGTGQIACRINFGSGIGRDNIAVLIANGDDIQFKVSVCTRNEYDKRTWAEAGRVTLSSRLPARGPLMIERSLAVVSSWFAQQLKIKSVTISNQQRYRLTSEGLCDD